MIVIHKTLCSFEIYHFTGIPHNVFKYFVVDVCDHVSLLKGDYLQDLCTNIS